LHDAVSEGEAVANSQELASDREAGIPPSSERDQKLRIPVEDRRLGDA
jgi:hypothetical protein